MFLYLTFQKICYYYKTFLYSNTSIEDYSISAIISFINIFLYFQEDQNRGKPNWEHLNDELHVLITVEDSENRAQMKLQRAIDEVKKLLTVV